MHKQPIFKRKTTKKNTLHIALHKLLFIKHFLPFTHLLHVVFYIPFCRYIIQYLLGNFSAFFAHALDCSSASCVEGNYTKHLNILSILKFLDTSFS